MKKQKLAMVFKQMRDKAYFMTIHTNVCENNGGHEE